MFLVFGPSNVKMDELIHIHENVIEFCSILCLCYRCDSKGEGGSEPFSESNDSHGDESIPSRGTWRPWETIYGGDTLLDGVEHQDSGNKQ